MHENPCKVGYSRAGPVKKLPLQELVRHRLRQRVATQNVRHEILAHHLGLSRSAVTRLLNDEDSGIGLHHIERLCAFFQITPCELMADVSAVIQEVKPLEAQLLHHFRSMTELERQSLLVVLDHRQVQPLKHRRARPGRTDLTEEQQLVVDLYARSDPQAREGVLKVLRGTARRTERAEHPTNGDRIE